MIKNRHFMFGLGSGLIAGALLLQLMIAGEAGPLSKEKVLKDAAQLNLKVVEQNAELLTEKEWEERSAVKQASPSPEESPSSSAAAISPEATPSSGAAPSPASEPSPANTPSAAASPEAASAPKTAGLPSDPAIPDAKNPQPDAAGVSVSVAPASPPASPQAPKQVMISLRIPNGATLDETANLLLEAGVIKDKNLFMKAAKKRKINTIIQYGAYSFEQGESIEAIIEQLITVK